VLHYTTADGLSDNAILALAAEPDGTVWAGTGSGGLHRFGKGALMSFGIDAGLSGQPVSALLPARGGGLWLGTGGGEVLRGQDGQFRQLDEAGSLAGKAIRAMYEDHHGRLWLGTASGRLACLSGGRFHTWDATPGLLEGAVTGILGNQDGDLWFATSKGIYRITGTEVTGWLGGSSPLRPQSFFEPEVPAGATSACGWPRALNSPDGRFWFATIAGVVNFEPLGLEPNSAPPTVRLESVLVNGQLLVPAGARGKGTRGPPQPAGWFTDGAAPLKLPSNLRSLDIQFTAFCFAAPEKLRFRHRLEGSDADWVDGGVERWVHYGRLPSGSYDFRVTACNAAGVWNQTGAGFAFRIPPPAWRAAWALGLYGCAVVGMVAGTARLVSYRRLRWRLARLAQEQAMQRERMRIAQDMHDEIGSKLTRISFMSELAKGQLQGQEPVAVKLDAIAHTSRDLLQSLDEIVWVVNPRNDTLEHLAAYLGHYATEYLQNTSVECELHIPRNLPHQPLSAETRHNLFLAFEEALNNALKHGRPSKVRVAMVAGPSRFEITIQDNGCGFDLAGVSPAAAFPGAARPPHGGNGLWNMRQRLVDVGGQCAITSQPGQGSTVSLSVPLNGEQQGIL
jgi:signal transduction histidine kinase